MSRKAHGPRYKIALAQCAPRLGDIQSNLLIHLELAEAAAAEGADLCIFPELGLTGYFLKDLVPDLAFGLDDTERLAPLLKLSRHLDLVVGTVVRSDDFRNYNAALYLSGGEITHVHRKVYLPTYGMFDEQRYFAPGDRVRAFNRGLLQAGLLVCEDMWHLSMPYMLFVQGAHLVICVSSSPGRGVLVGGQRPDAPGSVASWQRLCQTVAEYGICYVAYCNRLGFEDGVNFSGGSAVVAPDGRFVVDAGDRAGLTFADIDLREVQRQRVATPLLREENVEFTVRELQKILDERAQGPY